MSNKFSIFVTLREASKVDRIVGAIVSKGWTVGPIAEPLITGTSPLIVAMYVNVPSTFDDELKGCEIIRDEISSIINKLGTSCISLIVISPKQAVAWQSGSLDAPKKSTVANLKLVTSPEPTI